MDFIKTHIGERGFIVLIGLILIVCGLAFLVFIIRSSPNFIRTLVLGIVLIAGLALAWQMKIPEEKIHILEFAVLGWFAGKDLVERNRKIRGIILACMFTVTVGVLDEVFQAILPYRFWDVRDIGFNSLGGVWGVILYLLGTVPSGDSPFVKIKE